MALINKAADYFATLSLAVGGQTSSAGCHFNLQTGGGDKIARYLPIPGAGAAIREARQLGTPAPLFVVDAVPVPSWVVSNTPPHRATLTTDHNSCPLIVFSHHIRHSESANVTDSHHSHRHKSDSLAWPGLWARVLCCPFYLLSTPWLSRAMRTLFGIIKQSSLLLLPSPH